MVYCNEIEYSNAGCNEIELNTVGKLQNVSRGEQIKKKNKQKQKNKKQWRQVLKYCTTYKRNSYQSQKETL